MVQISELTKKYGQITAVNDISFEVKEHDVLGFLGPNGAGKSTTMNIITGCLPATSGNILIDGVSIYDNPKEVKKHIGYLPEIPPLYPDMKVGEYLKFVAGIKGTPKNQILSQVADSMDKLKIFDMEKRIIKNLSKGYRQRVGFAQALLGSPKLIILDEPTVGLDPNQTMEVRNLILELKKDHTIIFSSHILAEVTEICNTAVIINKGKIMRQDSMENLLKSESDNVTLSFKIEGDCKAVEKAIMSVDGVKEIVDTIDNGNNTYEYQVSVVDEGVRKKLFAKLGTIDCDILNVTTVSANLEAVFAKLTTTKQKPTAWMDEMKAEK